MKYYIAFDNEDIIWGIGHTEDAAIDNAKESGGLDFDDGSRVITLPCNKELYDEVDKNGYCHWDYAAYWYFNDESGLAELKNEIVDNGQIYRKIVKEQKIDSAFEKSLEEVTRFKANEGSVQELVELRNWKKSASNDTELLNFLERYLNGSYETIGHLQHRSQGYFPEGQPYYVGEISRYFGSSLREAVTNAIEDNYDKEQEQQHK